MYGKSRKGTIVSTCLIALMIQKFTLGSADYLLQFFRGAGAVFRKTNALSECVKRSHPVVGR